MNIPFPHCLPCLLLVSLFPALIRGQSVDFIGKGNSAVSWGVVEVRDLDHKNSTEGEIGDRISIEIKNFDGWIIEQIAAGNYPESQKPSDKIAKLINLGLFKDAINARNDAETPGGFGTTGLNPIRILASCQIKRRRPSSRINTKIS